jgi:pimeloyl-ACP methyl ester carboxylesterase
MPTIRMKDGREVMYAEWGDPGGVPIIALHGTPGCRLNRPPEEGKVRAEGIRLVTYDRPGYGASDRHRGRRVVDCAADVEALADALDIDRFGVTGGSGGGPHALAVGAPRGSRVRRPLRRRLRATMPGVDWFAGMDPERQEFGWALDGKTG